MSGTSFKAATVSITPHTVQLPAGGNAALFTREQLTALYACSHGELGRLLARKLIPLPIRVEGVIGWHADETSAAKANVAKLLEKWRR